MRESSKSISKKFIEDVSTEDYSMLQVIPWLITQKKNSKMLVTPTMDEVKAAVFRLNKDSTGGTDGFSSEIFHIVGK